jgi:hypothetical protein
VIGYSLRCRDADGQGGRRFAGKVVGWVGGVTTSLGQMAKADVLRLPPGFRANPPHVYCRD